VERVCQGIWLDTTANWQYFCAKWLLAYEWEDRADWGVTMQGKQAKILSPTQERAIVGYLDTTRYPHRDRVMFLLVRHEGVLFSARKSQDCR